MPTRLRNLLAIAATCLAGFSYSLNVIAQSTGFEYGPNVNLADILPAEIIRSSNHQIDDAPELRRNHINTTIESDYGSYRVQSIPMLLRRVHEIRTLSQAIDNFQRSNEQLAVKLRGQLQVGADSFVQILAQPFRTSGELASQLGSNVGQTIEAINDPSSQNQDDQKSSGAPTAADDPILASHKRSVAGQLDLDVYSSNPRVQSFLNEVAYARSHGRATAGTVSVGLGRPVVQPVNGGVVDANARSAVTRNELGELAAVNAGKLGAMGIGDPLVDAFLSHPHLTPRHQTDVVEYLEFVGRITNRGALLEVALNARNESEATGVVESARMLGLYHEVRRPLTELLAAGHLVVARAADRSMVVVLPFDVLYWNEETARVFGSLLDHAKSAGYRNTELVLTGLITPLAREKLETAGFAILDRFGLRS